jgi:hypothetical protein
MARQVRMQKGSARLCQVDLQQLHCSAPRRRKPACRCIAVIRRQESAAQRVFLGMCSCLLLPCVMQRQQLQQQAPRVDVLVVAADVCNKTAMERAVREHVSRCAAAFHVSCSGFEFSLQQPAGIQRTVCHCAHRSSCRCSLCNRAWRPP